MPGQIVIWDAVKGRLCAQDQPDKGKTGFVHFLSRGTTRTSETRA